MSTMDILGVVSTLVIFGIILGIGAFVRRSRQRKFRAQYGEEYDIELKKIRQRQIGPKGIALA
jgi:hypothetical protein